MEQVMMTSEERREYEAFLNEKKKKELAERRKANREQYAALVDAEVNSAIGKLSLLSEHIASVKLEVYRDFAAILDMKREVMGMTAEGQRSHTFTTSDGQMRLTLGVNAIDDYRDTVEDGIRMVRSYIESLATDEKTQSLVAAVLRLLSRDGKGNIKASRVLQLRKMAEDTGDECFLEGVRIIEESYQPTESKTYIRAERRDGQGAWRTIPLGVTEA